MALPCPAHSSWSSHSHAFRGPSKELLTAGLCVLRPPKYLPAPQTGMQWEGTDWSLPPCPYSQLPPSLLEPTRNSMAESVSSRQPSDMTWDVNKQVVVYDFRALGGPVYADITHENLSHFECLREASHHGFLECSIYAQGGSRALEPGDTILATLGCVIQFQPIGTAAQWCSTLNARFDRPQWWLAHPSLPEDITDRPVLTLYHDRCLTYSARRFSNVQVLPFLADLVDRTPDRVLFVAPAGDELTDVVYRGTPCRDALAVYPLTPSTDRQGILIFLDARQAGLDVTHTYLQSANADPHVLVRYLHLRPLNPLRNQTALPTLSNQLLCLIPLYHLLANLPATAEPNEGHPGFDPTMLDDWITSDSEEVIEAIQAVRRSRGFRSTATVVQWSAGLLPGLDYEVLFGVDQIPVGEDLVHLFPGALVVIVTAAISDNSAHQGTNPVEPSSTPDGSPDGTSAATGSSSQHRHADTGSTPSGPDTQGYHGRQEPIPGQEAGSDETLGHHQTADTSDAVTVLATFFICVPDFAPEILTVRIPIPCTPQQALQLVTCARNETRRQWFPRLLPASQQPYPDKAILIAMPPWATAYGSLQMTTPDISPLIAAGVRFSDGTLRGVWVSTAIIATSSDIRLEATGNGEVFTVSFEPAPSRLWDDTGPITGAVRTQLPQQGQPSDQMLICPAGDKQPLASTVATMLDGPPQVADALGLFTGGASFASLLASSVDRMLPCQALHIQVYHRHLIRTTIGPMEITCGSPVVCLMPILVGPCVTPLHSRPDGMMHVIPMVLPPLLRLLADPLPLHVEAPPLESDCLTLLMTENLLALIPRLTLSPCLPPSSAPQLLLHTGWGPRCWNNLYSRLGTMPFTLPAHFLPLYLNIHLKVLLSCRLLALPESHSSHLVRPHCHMQVFCGLLNMSPHIESSISLRSACPLHVYTDGSFDGEHAAWAFHVCAHTDSGSFHLGWQGARLTQDPDGTDYLGQYEAGAFPAEVAALFWTACWCLQLPQYACIDIFSDCTSAIAVFDGTGGDYPQDTLSGKCRAASQLLSTVTGQSLVASCAQNADHISVAALQETRTVNSATYVSASHIRFTSAKETDGTCGVELWFDRQHALFSDHEGRPIHFQPGRDVWWDALFQLLRRIAQDAHLVLLGGYNLHMHHSHSAAIGDLVWGTPNPDPPAAFYRLLDHFALWIPSTFDACHTGDTATWHSPAGAGSARLDYIAVPVSWKTPRGGSATNPRLDWGQSRADHVAVQLWVRGTVTIGKAAGRKHSRLNTAAMRTPEGRLTLEHICRNVPLQPWDLDVHRHAQALDTYFRDHLARAFPVGKSSCRHEYFQASTWQLRSKREWLRKRVKGASRTINGWHLQAAFHSWHCRRRLADTLLACWAPVLWSLRDLPVYLEDLRSSSKALRSAIRQDHLEHIRNAAAASESSSTQAIVQRLRTLTGGPKRKQRDRSPLPAVERADGTLAATHEEAKQCWLEHFSSIEAGSLSSPTELVRACISRQQAKDIEDYHVSHGDAPTLGHLEWALRDTSTDRAYGLDGLPGELLHFCAPLLAKPIYQLQLKSLLTLAEPVQHKGGILHCVYKHKGSRQLCSSYRGILVSSVVSKSLHKLLRKKCVPALHNVASPLQVGGLPGYPVTVPAHVTRMYQSACLQKGSCHGVLFLDLQEAFYRIVRPLVTGGPLTEEAIAAACRAVHMPSGVYHDIQRRLQQLPLSSAAGASPWVTRALEETLQNTWFCFAGEDELVTTAIGSRPGDSLSDLVFSLLFARVLKQVRTALSEAGHVPSIPWHADMIGRLTPLDPPPTQTISLLDATWMDDLSMLLQATNSSELVERLTAGASTLLDTCLEHALLPNLKRGKTEALVHLRARHARQMRQQLFVEQEGTVPLRCRLWTDAKLRLTATYKHLGGVLHHRGCLLREVKARAAQAWVAFNSRKQKIFSSPKVSSKDKALLFDSLVASTLFYGSGTWPDPSPECIRKLTGTLRGMASQMLRPAYDCAQAWKLGTARTLALARIPTAVTYLHVHRLRYMLSCIVLSVPELWALAHWEQTWMRGAAESVRWLWERADPDRQYPDWTAAWAAWRDEAQQHPGRWKARIRKAQRCALAQEYWQAELQRHQGLLLRQLQQVGASVSAQSDYEEESKECCAVCRKRFRDYRAWSVHAFSTHARTDEMRRLAPGTQCPVCLKHFTSATKLSRHLGYSRLCRGRLLSTNDRHTPEPGVGSRKAPDDGVALMPVLQASGPHQEPLQFFVEEESARPCAEVLDCLLHIDHDGTIATAGETELWDRLRIAFSCVCLQATRLSVTAQCWQRLLSDPHHSVSECTLGILRGAAHWLCSNNLVSWLVPEVDDGFPATDTFRLSGLYLASLTFTGVVWPAPSATSPETIWVQVGPVPSEFLPPVPEDRWLRYQHREALADRAADTAVDYLDNTDTMSCVTMLPSAVLSWDIVRALQLASQLLAPELGSEAFELRAEAVAQCPWDLSAWAAWLKTRPFPLAALQKRTEAAEAAAAWPGGVRNLSRSRPVRASVDEDRAHFVVDGTDSEWFPADAAEPQWLEIDLEQASVVHEVRVKWWGDYGSRNSLRILSLLQDEGLEGTDDAGVLVERGRRQHKADFNGWTELPGWEDPTRILRFEVGNPCPDCFGLKKSYGIRRIEIMGCRMAEGSPSLEALLLRLAEASFPELEELPHQQALRLVQRMIKSSGL
ncbi:unnamed protein product [Symbiodinium sp. CCMP2592]|nr:unnamed protein product [Symbiodinium sp. CCMP2592]